MWFTGFLVKPVLLLAGRGLVGGGGPCGGQARTPYAGKVVRFRAGRPVHALKARSPKLCPLAPSEATITNMEPPASSPLDVSTAHAGLLFTAFEPSGDDHASAVIAELRRRHPTLPIYAWGGPLL